MLVLGPSVPRAAAGKFLLGTLKTSLCATRLFPTADCPAKISLQQHACVLSTAHAEATYKLRTQGHPQGGGLGESFRATRLGPVLLKRKTSLNEKAERDASSVPPAAAGTGRTSRS